MKKIILGVLISLTTLSNAFADCSYNLNATPTEIAQLYSGQVITEKFPTVNFQEYGIQINSTDKDLYSYKHYAAGSSTFVKAVAAWEAASSNEAELKGDIVLPPSGIYAFEFKITSFPFLTNVGYSDINLGAMIVGTSKNQRSVNIIPLISRTATGFMLRVDVVDKLGGTAQTVSYPLYKDISNYRFGIYINQNSKQIGLIVGGANKGYISTPLTNKIDALGFILQGQMSNISSSSPYLNKYVGGKLVTDKNQFISTYPLGTKDICGNYIR